MATQSVAIAPQADPEMYGAEPVHGNYTADAATHLWCANALATLVACPDRAMYELNADIQAAIRYLLQCEVERAMKAEAAGA